MPAADVPPESLIPDLWCVPERLKDRNLLFFISYHLSCANSCLVRIPAGKKRKKVSKFHGYGLFEFLFGPRMSYQIVCEDR